MVVYQYRIALVGMKVWDADLVQRVCRLSSRQMELALGLFTVSGE